MSSRIVFAALLVPVTLAGCATIAPPRTADFPGHTYQEVFDATVAGLCGMKKFVVHAADSDQGIIDFIILGTGQPFQGHMKLQAIVSRDGRIPGMREMKQWRKMRAEAVKSGATPGNSPTGDQPPSVTLIQFSETHPFSVKVHAAIEQSLSGPPSGTPAIDSKPVDSSADPAPAQSQ